MIAVKTESISGCSLPVLVSPSLSTGCTTKGKEQQDEEKKGCFSTLVEPENKKSLPTPLSSTLATIITQQVRIEKEKMDPPKWSKEEMLPPTSLHCRTTSCSSSTSSDRIFFQRKGEKEDVKKETHKEDLPPPPSPTEEGWTDREEDPKDTMEEDEESQEYLTMDYETEAEDCVNLIFGNAQLSDDEDDPPHPTSPNTNVRGGRRPPVDIPQLLLASPTSPASPRMQPLAMEYESPYSPFASFSFISPCSRSSSFHSSFPSLSSPHAPLSRDYTRRPPARTSSMGEYSMCMEDRYDRPPTPSSARYPSQHRMEMTPSPQLLSSFSFSFASAPLSSSFSSPNYTTTTTTTRAKGCGHGTPTFSGWSFPISGSSQVGGSFSKSNGLSTTEGGFNGSLLLSPIPVTLPPSSLPCSTRSFLCDSSLEEARSGGPPAAAKKEHSATTAAAGKNLPPTATLLLSEEGEGDVREAHAWNSTPALRDFSEWRSCTPRWHPQDGAGAGTEGDAGEKSGMFLSSSFSSRSSSSSSFLFSSKSNSCLHLSAVAAASLPSVVDYRLRKREVNRERLEADAQQSLPVWLKVHQFYLLEVRRRVIARRGGGPQWTSSSFSCATSTSSSSSDLGGMVAGDGAQQALATTASPVVTMTNPLDERGGYPSSSGEGRNDRFLASTWPSSLGRPTMTTTTTTPSTSSESSRHGNGMHRTWSSATSQRTRGFFPSSCAVATTSSCYMELLLHLAFLELQTLSVAVKKHPGWRSESVSSSPPFLPPAFLHGKRVERQAKKSHRMEDSHQEEPTGGLWGGGPDGGATYPTPCRTLLKRKEEHRVPPLPYPSSPHPIAKPQCLKPSHWAEGVEEFKSIVQCLRDLYSLLLEPVSPEECEPHLEELMASCKEQEGVSYTEEEGVRVMAPFSCGGGHPLFSPPPPSSSLPPAETALGGDTTRTSQASVSLASLRYCTCTFFSEEEEERRERPPSSQLSLGTGLGAEGKGGVRASRAGVSPPCSFSRILWGHDSSETEETRIKNWMYRSFKAILCARRAQKEEVLAKIKQLQPTGELFVSPDVVPSVAAASPPPPPPPFSLSVTPTIRRSSSDSSNHNSSVGSGELLPGVAPFSTMPSFAETLSFPSFLLSVKEEEDVEKVKRENVEAEHHKTALGMNLDTKTKNKAPQPQDKKGVEADFEPFPHTKVKREFKTEETNKKGEKDEQNRLKFKKKVRRRYKKRKDKKKGDGAGTAPGWIEKMEGRPLQEGRNRLLHFQLYFSPHPPPDFRHQNSPCPPSPSPMISAS